MTDTQNNLNEAPASATLSVITPKGFNTLFTIRDMSVNELIKKITIVEEKISELGYKPQIKPVFGAKKEVSYVEGKLCPVDGGKLKIINSKDGKTYWSCENGKYDYTTKVKSGCQFFTSPDQYEKKKTEMQSEEYLDQI